MNNKGSNRPAPTASERDYERERLIRLQVKIRQLALAGAISEDEASRRLAALKTLELVTPPLDQR